MPSDHHGGAAAAESGCKQAGHKRVLSRLIRSGTFLHETRALPPVDPDAVTAVRRVWFLGHGEIHRRLILLSHVHTKNQDPRNHKLNSEVFARKSPPLLSSRVATFTLVN